MSDELKPPTLDLLVLELKEIVDWELLSVHLHLGNVYERIQFEYGHMGTERCKLELFNLWLRRNKTITWERIVAALERMDEIKLASNLREKYSTILHKNGECTTCLEIVLIKTKPQKMFVRIKEKFARLLEQIKILLKTCRSVIDLDCFFEYLETFVPGIQRTSSIEGLYSEVRKHCDFLHFSLIGHIVRYDSLKRNENFQKIRKKYKKYEKDLQKFKNSTEMKHLITTINNHIEINGMVPVKIKFESFLEKIRLKEFTELLKEIFHSQFEFLVKMEVTEGCFCIHWLVPTSIGNEMIIKFAKSNELCDFMGKIGVLSLQINETLILKREANVDSCQVAFHTAIRSQNVAACEFLLYAFHDEILKEYPLKQNLSILVQSSVSLIEVSCSHGHLQVVRTLLRLGFYNERPRSTPLMIASAEGHLSVVNLLLESVTVDVNKQGPDGETALHLSCSKQQIAVVKCLLQYARSNHHSVDVDMFDNNEMTPLMISAGSGQRKIVCELLQTNANPNKAKKNGDTALHIACCHGNCGVVRELLKFKADPNVSKVDGWTPLMVAIPSNHMKVVELLLKFGEVDPNKQNEQDGDNALMIASWNNCHDIVKLLLSKNAEPNITKDDGWTPLIAASLLGFDDIACTLIKNGATINIQANDGVTSLYVACQEGHSSVVSLLIDRGADIHLWKTDNESGVKYTPFAIACQNGHVNVVELLLEKDHTQLEKTNESGATPLFIAAYNNQAAVLKFLLDKNANPFSLDNQGQNALDVTQDNICQELLLKAGVIESIPKTTEQTPVVKQGAYIERFVANAKNLTARLVGRQFIKNFQRFRQWTRRETRNM